MSCRYAFVFTVLHAVEEQLAWPEQASTLFMCLIPKAGGGVRPIGLYPALVRIWERVRAPLMRAWYLQAARAYDWACVGGSADKATALITGTAASKDLVEAGRPVLKRCHRLREEIHLSTHGCNFWIEYLRSASF